MKRSGEIGELTLGESDAASKGKVLISDTIIRNFKNILIIL